MTTIMDGRTLAATVLNDVRARIAALEVRPALRIVMVGDQPASKLYVKHKKIAADTVGIECEIVCLPEGISQSELWERLKTLNSEPINGLLVQLPLPAHIDVNRVIQEIDPCKDVDGFHPENVGLMTNGKPALLPCTPKGIMCLLQAHGIRLQGARALVVGCSAIVGRPVSTMLSRASATVTIAHKLTRDLAEEVRRAEIVVVAAGCPNLIRGKDIREGAVIIDVGINRLSSGKIVGDVAFDECLGVASAITPVPGGVGPMTVACLMENTLQAALGVSH